MAATFSGYSTYPTTVRFRLFALIIGINEYATLPSNDTIVRALRGAVDDALQFKYYFEHSLGVPADQITLRINEKATYSTIIQDMKNLRTDTRIRKGDAIVIFFAGHGTEIIAPANWEVGNPNRKIQSLVPYDCDTIKSGKRVTPIPDYIINSLLSAIAKQHGNNITVILDCCHAASGTRSSTFDVDGDETEFTPRSVDFLNRDYSSILDQSFLDTGCARGAYRNPQFAHHGLGSHVLLAACSANEQALERNFYDRHLMKSVQRGQFSMALLGLFQTRHPTQLRYLDILNFLEKIPGQNPQCEGLEKNRFLFNGVITSLAPRMSFEVKLDDNEVDPAHPGYIVMAGTIHNITKDSEFTVYYEDNMDIAIGVLRVHSLQAFWVSATPLSRTRFFNITSAGGSKAIAIQTRFGRKSPLNVWIDPTSALSSAYNQIEAYYREELKNVSIVPERRDSDIEISTTNQQQINMKYFATSTLLLGSIFSWHNNIGMDTLPQILYDAAKFYGELKREDDDPYISKGVSVEFFELTFNRSLAIEDPSRSGLYPSNNRNLLQNGVVNIGISEHSSDSVPYGIKLTNNTNFDLYLNMFFLMNSDLKIAPHVLTGPGGPYNVDIHLPKKNGGPPENPQVMPGTLAIGWGAAGYHPFCFRLTREQKYDVDFLKIFLTTQPVDLSSISSLVGDSSLGIVSRKPTAWVPPPVASWSHIIVPIIQRRGSVS